MQENIVTGFLSRDAQIDPVGTRRSVHANSFPDRFQR
jgi:hypothetical protein